MTSNEDVREERATVADESSDAQPMAEQGHEGLLTGPLGGGAWSSAWSVPVGLAWQEVVANNQQGQEEIEEQDGRGREAAGTSPANDGGPQTD